MRSLAAFALGCLMLNAGISRVRALALGLAFALATPAGSLLGMLVPTGGQVSMYMHACACTCGQVGSLLGMLVPTGGQVSMYVHACACMCMCMHMWQVGSLVSSGLVAMAGGSFTFVALLEILPRELSPHGRDRRDRGGHSRDAGGTASKLSKLVALGVGFGAMALLANWL